MQKNINNTSKLFPGLLLLNIALFIRIQRGDEYFLPPYKNTPRLSSVELFTWLNIYTSEAFAEVGRKTNFTK